MVSKMPKSSLPWWAKVNPFVKSSARNQGFTLIELLIAMIVGSIIIGSLLYVVVELLQINRREELLTQTQQDMRRAIDYITRDTSEAIYVYADPTDITDQITDPPQNNPPAIPVLAFWRLDPLSDAELEAIAAVTCTGETASRCETLRVRQSTYTLVVYYYLENQPNSDILWEGPARIVRYELPQYVNLRNAANRFAQRTGYNDPSLTDNFAEWARSGATTDGIKAVLTDSIAEGDDDLTCPADYRFNANAPSSFYTCVLVGETLDDVGVLSGTNQSMRVFLQGNAETNRFGITAFSESGKLPALESEVLIRGVLQRQPGS